MKHVASAVAAAWLTATIPPATAQTAMKQRTPEVRTIASTAPDVQLVYGKIMDQDPSRFRINFDFNVNAGVSETAPSYAVYFDDTIPARCADFRGITFPFTKQGRQGIFDVRAQMPQIFQALNQYRCITISNQTMLTQR